MKNFLGLLLLFNIFLDANGQGGGITSGGQMVPSQVGTSQALPQGQMSPQGFVTTQNPVTGQLQNTPMTTPMGTNPGGVTLNPFQQPGIQTPTGTEVQQFPGQGQVSQPGVQNPGTGGTQQYPSQGQLLQPGVQTPIAGGIQQYPGQGQTMMPMQYPGQGQNMMPMQYPGQGQNMMPMQYPGQGQNMMPNVGYPSGLYLNTPQSQLGYQWMTMQLSNMLNDPQSREGLVLLFAYLPGILANPRFPAILQAFNSRLDGTMNNPQSYNDFIHGYNIQPTSSIMHSVGGVQGGNLWDSMMKKKDILGRTISNTIQAATSGVTELLGGVPILGDLSKTGSGMIGNTFSMFADPLKNGRVDSVSTLPTNSGTGTSSRYPTFPKQPLTQTVPSTYSSDYPVHNQAFGQHYPQTAF